jgi:hypothetical protein
LVASEVKGMLERPVVRSTGATDGWSLITMPTAAAATPPPPASRYPPVISNVIASRRDMGWTLPLCPLLGVLLMCTPASLLLVVRRGITATISHDVLLLSDEMTKKH